MSQGHTSPGEGRKPRHERLPDERLRVTRYTRKAKGAKLRNGLWLDWGTLIEGPLTGEHADWADCRLINQYVEEGDDESWLVQVYESIPATAEVQVGENTRISLEDGRAAVEAEFLQFTAGTYVPGTVGSSTAPGDASAYLLKAEQTNDGCLRRIKRTYVHAGQLSQDDQSLNNGKLLKRTLVYAKTVPSTPSGYTLVGSPVQHPNGLPVYTYTFAKGDGEISRFTDYNQSDDGGTTGVTVVTIVHLTASSVSSDPTSSPGAGFVKISERKPDQDGYRQWTVVYAKGTGLVSQAIEPGPAGLRRVTNVSLGSKVSPSGEVVSDTYRIADGYKVYTVAALQEADGGTDLGTVEVEVERLVPFTYPGRAKAYSEDINGYTLLDVYQDPPITVKVKATVTISYVTTTTLGVITPTLWNPDSSAVIRAQWVGFGPEPSNLVKALPGYRSVDATPVTETASGFAPGDLSIFGNPVSGAEDATIVVEGGPENPDGNEYTLDTWIEEDPAFTTISGTKWHRKVQIVATIPTQTALPV